MRSGSSRLEGMQHSDAIREVWRLHWSQFVVFVKVHVWGENGRCEESPTLKSVPESSGVHVYVNKSTHRVVKENMVPVQHLDLSFATCWSFPFSTRWSETRALPELLRFSLSINPLPLTSKVFGSSAWGVIAGSSARNLGCTMLCQHSELGGLGLLPLMLVETCWNLRECFKQILTHEMFCSNPVSISINDSFQRQSMICLYIHLS